MKTLNWSSECSIKKKKYLLHTAFPDANKSLLFWSLDRWRIRQKAKQGSKFHKGTMPGEGWRVQSESCPFNLSFYILIAIQGFFCQPLLTAFLISSTEYWGGGLKGQEKWKVFRYAFCLQVCSLFPLCLSFCSDAWGKRTWHHFHHVDSSGFLKCCDPWKAQIHAYLHSSLRQRGRETEQADCWCGGWACWITPEPQLGLPLSECQPALPSLFSPATWPSPICCRIHKMLKITNIWTYYS